MTLKESQSPKRVPIFDFDKVRNRSRKLCFSSFSTLLNLIALRFIKDGDVHSYHVYFLRNPSLSLFFCVCVFFPIDVICRALFYDTLT